MSMLTRILLIVVGYVLWRWMAASLRKPRPARPVHPGAQWLVKDPVCDTYVPQSNALPLKVGRETLYFCSEDCRRRHLACTA